MLAPSVTCAPKKETKKMAESDNGVSEAFTLAATATAYSSTRLRCIVAIPVKDEAQRLPACMAALSGQKDQQARVIPSDSFGIVIFANNCRDDSARLAVSLGERYSLPLRIIDATLPPAAAHAGNARRGAMDVAAAWLAEERVAGGGVILTTDADSRVSPHWIANNVAEIDAGADCVLGSVVVDEEGDLLPPALHRRGRLEAIYETLLTEISALLDPVEQNPWRHHATISGARIAMTREAYLAIGGVPRVPLGEDKALVAELVRRDGKIRFFPDVEVTTSGRTEGRAPGGVADTLRLRSGSPNSFCNDALVPFRIAIERAKCRRRVRILWSAGDLIGDRAWSQELGISEASAKRVFGAATLGAALAIIENCSPLLSRRL
jgi:cellulose synthase/poly-beta-1,6-N-acetylglucosamine synthase-like glycosyltransferase